MFLLEKNSQGVCVTFTVPPIYNAIISGQPNRHLESEHALLEL
jgi:hypothetical protein